MSSTQQHIVVVRAEQRHTRTGPVRRRWVARCSCGWAEGWLTTQAAQDRAHQHQADTGKP